MSQFADDHVFEVSFDEPENLCENMKITYGGTTYTLKQLHFHTPSEHTVGRGRADAEVHMVHMTDDKTKTLVLGVLMNSKVRVNNLLCIYTYHASYIQCFI